MSNRHHLESLQKSLFEALESHHRFYELSPTAIAVVDIGNHYDRASDTPLVKARVDLYLRTDEVEDGKVTSSFFDLCDWQELDAPMLVRLAEVVVFADRWNRNELETLPPSTTSDPRKDEQRGRRVHRRRR